MNPRSHVASESFGTNVIAIILGAAGSLFALGVRGRSGASHHQLWVRYSFLLLLVGLGALAFPLSKGLLTHLAANGGTAIPADLEARLGDRLGAGTGARILSVEQRLESDGPVIEIHLSAPRPPSAKMTSELARLVKDELGEDLHVRVSTELAVDIR